MPQPQNPVPATAQAPNEMLAALLTAAQASGGQAPGTAAPAPAAAPAAPLAPVAPVQAPAAPASPPAAPLAPAPAEPAAVPAPAAPAPAAPAAPAEAPQTLEEALAALQEAQNTAEQYRTRNAELEPLTQSNQELAAQLEAAQFQTLVAAHSIPEDRQWLVAAVPAEHRAAAAQLLGGQPAAAPAPPAPAGLPAAPAAPQAPAAVAPPSQRPLEFLRPGAVPAPPAVPDTSYPAGWNPNPPKTS